MDNEMINLEYRHTRIDLSEEQLKQTLPGNVFGTLNGKKTILFGTIDGTQKLIALAVFSVSEIHYQEMVLEYIVVSEERRHEELAHELLEYSAATLRNCGVCSLYVRLVEEMDKIAGLYDFLVSQKFIPVLFSGRFMSYHMSDLRQCELMRHGNDLMGAFGRKIKKIDQHLDVGVKQFMQRQTGSHIRQDVYDMKYSRIFLDEDGIKGAVFFKQIDAKTFAMTGCWMDAGSNERYILAALLSSALQEVMGLVKDDAVLAVQLYRSEYSIWIKKMLGQAAMDLLMQEYVRKL